MKKRNVISILLYVIGGVLWAVSNSAIVSDSPVHVANIQQVILCGAAVGLITISPFIYKAKTTSGTITKFIIAVALLYGIFTFSDFAGNSVVDMMGLRW